MTVTEARHPLAACTHRGQAVNEPLGGHEPQVSDVAAALLLLAAPDRRAAIGPLIAMIERVVAGGEDQRPDPGPDLRSGPRGAATDRPGYPVGGPCRGAV
jgi:hypothetical protein